MSDEPVTKSCVDPRPVEPQAPGPGECCESGCPICVFDLYAEELRDYREKLAAWKVRNPGIA